MLLFLSQRMRSSRSREKSRRWQRHRRDASLTLLELETTGNSSKRWYRHQEKGAPVLLPYYHQLRELLVLLPTSRAGMLLSSHSAQDSACPWILEELSPG